jgi:hypothetical protein
LAAQVRSGPPFSEPFFRRAHFLKKTPRQPTAPGGANNNGA